MKVFDRQSVVKCRLRGKDYVLIEQPNAAISRRERREGAGG